MSDPAITAEEARRLREAATPGPWHALDNGEVVTTAGVVAEVMFLKDAALIAAAPSLAAEVERLSSWKQEAIQVIASWEKIHERLGRPGRLGESKAAATLAEVEAMADRIDLLRDQVGRLTRERDEWEANEQEQAAEVERLAAENERHRRANLVRSVIDGWDEAIDGGLTDYINEHGWDAVPWKVAERLSGEVERLRAALNDGRMALARAIGLMEAHWEVCADPFPDASLRRVIDQMDAAQGGSHE